MPDNISSLPIVLPKGVKDFLPESASRLKALEDKILRSFELWGYRKVITPAFEYLDTLAAVEPDLLERMFKFEDRASGRMLALRPDFTAQVARLVASHLKEHPKPLRLHYSGSILHYGAKDMAARREVYQSGLELIGLDMPEADGEVIAIAIEAMCGAGLSGFKINVGQVEFFRGVMEGLNVPAERRSDIEAAIARKDRSGIEQLLPALKLSGRDEETLISLTGLFGGRDVIDAASRITSNKKAIAALENLNEVLDTVDLYGYGDFITIDLGEIRGLNYYTGVIFEGFVHSLGEAVCGGGRYDSLVNHFGYNTPATGFAIDLELLGRALKGKALAGSECFADYLLFNAKSDRNDALAVASYLRSEGIKVSRDILKRSLEDSMAYAGMEGIEQVIVVGGEGEEDSLTVHHLQTGEKKKIKTSDLLDGSIKIAG